MKTKLNEIAISKNFVFYSQSRIHFTFILESVFVTASY